MLMTFWQARIYCGIDDYDPTPESTKTAQSAIDSCAVYLSVGLIPERVLSAQGYADTALYHLIGWPGVMPTGVPVEWNKERKLFATILISMDIDMQVLCGEYLDLLQERCWYATHPAELGRTRFLSKTKPIFERVSGSLLKILGPEIICAAMPNSAVFVERAGYATMPVTVSSAGAAQGSVTRQMEELDSVSLATALSPVSTKKKRELLEAAGRWVGTALQEKDVVKQFLWCFAGLDAIGSKSFSLGPQGQLSRQVFFKPTNSADTFAGVALDQLLWPTAHRESMKEFPDRNITFKFAAMALTVSPQTANEDVELFKRMADFRNRIHGGDVLDLPTAEEFAPEALKLLIKYTNLTVKRI